MEQQLLNLCGTGTYLCVFSIGSCETMNMYRYRTYQHNPKLELRGQNYRVLYPTTMTDTTGFLLKTVPCSFVGTRLKRTEGGRLGSWQCGPKDAGP